MIATIMSMNLYLTITLFWTMVALVTMLTWIGARPVEDPYIITGQTLTILYFMYFIINPLMYKMWDKHLF